MSTQAAIDSLPRLVRLLQARQAGLEKESWISVRNGYKTVQYARQLLSSARERGDELVVKLDDLDDAITGLESAFQIAVERHPIPSSSKTSAGDRTASSGPRISMPSISVPDIAILRPSDGEPKAELASTSSGDTKDALVEQLLPTVEPSAASLSPPISGNASQRVERPIPSANPLAQQVDRDAQTLDTKSAARLPQRLPPSAFDDDDFLLPLPKHDQAQNRRAQLLAGAPRVSEGREAGMKGARELHEELGEQLADMSKQLRLNALHFAKGLEDEKGLLESAGATLEKNLSSTQSSKTKLSTVSKKTRGTTWLTFVTVLVVFIAWMWTYLIIRMT